MDGWESVCAQVAAALRTGGAAAAAEARAAVGEFLDALPKRMRETQMRGIAEIGECDGRVREEERVRRMAEAALVMVGEAERGAGPEALRNFAEVWKMRDAAIQ